MPKDVLWDSRAAKKIEEQELDKHFTKNKKHYIGLAKEAWSNLQDINERPQYLKHGDLFDVLLPVISRDSVTLKAFQERKLPAPLERMWATWHAWFTHYVVERFLQSIKAAEDKST